jgi:hypothetical protein
MATKSKKKRRVERTLYNSLRKPVAPPGHALTQAKPDEKARPAGRKAKHKRRPEEADTE